MAISEFITRSTQVAVSAHTMRKYGHKWPKMLPGPQNFNPIEIPVAANNHGSKFQNLFTVHVILRIRRQLHDL